MNNLIILSGPKGSGKSTCGRFLMKNYGYHQMSFASRLKDIVAWVYDLPRDRLDGLTEEDRAWREYPHPDLRTGREYHKDAVISGFRNTHEYLWTAKLPTVLEMIYGYQKPNNVPNYKFNGLSYLQAVGLVSSLLQKYIYPYDLSPRQALQILGTEVFRSIHPDTWCLALQVQIEELRKQDPNCKIVVTDGRFENEALWARQQGALLIYVDRAIEAADAHASEDTARFKELADIVLLNERGLDELEDSLLALVACSKEIRSEQFVKV